VIIEKMIEFEERSFRSAIGFSKQALPGDGIYPSMKGSFACPNIVLFNSPQGEITQISTKERR
jgi:hypothetical protein